MVKKSLGFTELQWTCPSCGTQNRGTARFCINCGTVQPEDVEFHQATNEQIITDIEAVKKANAGADIYCFYCGTRNPADAENCSQCGADLSQGTRRTSGTVVGAFSESSDVEQIPCPSCGSMIDPDVATCPYCGAPIASAKEPPPTPPPTEPAKSGGNKGVLIGVAAFLLVACVAIYFIFIRTSDASARVDGVSWTRSVAIEALGPVQYEDWRTDIPAGAVLGVCTQKVAKVVDNPVPNSTEVCGTPYTVDKGNGYGEVVQDCQYEVYADWCEYTVQEWQVVDQVVVEGNDYAPRDPAPQLSANQREGARSAEYIIHFDSDGQKYTFTTTDEALFNRAQIGSRWILKVNSLNAVTGIEPAE